MTVAGTLDLNGYNITVGSLSSSTSSALITDNSTTAGTTTLTTNQATSTSYAGAIQDGSARTLALAKAGSGTLTLSGTNTYRGGTTLSGGTLRLGSTSALGARTGALAMASGATLDLYANSLTVGVLSGTGGTIMDSNSASGADTLTVNQFSNSTYAGVIQYNSTRSVALVKSGGGTLTLAGANTYRGGTTLNAGTLQMSNAAGLSSTGTLTVNGGVLDLNGYSVTVGPLSGTGGIITDNSATAGITTFTVNTSASSSYYGAIQDGITRTLALSTSGGGSLGLGGTHTFTGPTTINGGSLDLQYGSSNHPVLPFTSEICLSNTGSLTLSGYFNQTFDRKISGSGYLYKTGGGTVTLTGTNTYQGSTNIYGGTLRLGNVSALGATTGTLQVFGGTLDLNGYNIAVGMLGGDAAGTITDSNATPGTTTLTVAQSSTSTFAGTIQDDGLRRVALVKSGSGVLTLSGTNTFSGGTTISAGTIRPGNTSAFGMGMLTIASGATLDLYGNNTTVSGLSGGGTLTDTTTTSGISTLTVNQSGNSTYAGTVTYYSPRRVALLKSGSGTLTLSGNDGYLQNITLAAGTVSVSSGYNFGDQTTFSGGTLRITGTTLTGIGNANWTTFTGGIDVADAANTVTISNAISGSGSLTKLGAGMLVLSGNNTFTGGVTLVGGELSIAANANLGGTSNPLTFNGGTLQVTGTAMASFGSHTVNWTTFNGGLDIANSAHTFTVNNAVSGSGQVTKSGAGKLILGGANSYSGGTTLGGGTLQLNNASALGASSGTLTVNSGTLDLNANSITVAALSGSGGTITDNNATAGTTTLTVNQSSNTTFAGAIQNGATRNLALVKSGTGTLTLSGTNTFSGGTTLNAGELSVSSDSNLGGASTPITFAGGMLQVTGTTLTSFGSHAVNGTSFNGGLDTVNAANTFTVGNTLSGSGSLTKQGAGTLILNGANSYSGGTTLGGGTLQLGNASALGNTAGTLTVNQGTTLNLNANSITVGYFSGTGGTITDNSTAAGTSTVTVNEASNATFAGALQDGGTRSLALTVNGAGVLTLTGTNTFSGPTTVSNGASLQLGNGSTSNGSLTTTSGVSLGDNALLTIANPSDQTFDRAISGTGSVTKQGAGTLIFSGNNSYTGGTTLVAGKLSVGSDNNLGAATAPIAFSGGAIQVTGTTLSSFGSHTINWGTFTGGLDIANAANTFTIGDEIGGSGSLTKSGAGTLVLSGDNSYSGGTTVTQGELSVTGTLASAVGVLGGTLSGTGTLTTVTLTSGTLSPGTGDVGTLNTGGLALGAGANFRVDLSDSGSDQVNVSGTVSINSLASLTIASSTRESRLGDVLVLIDNDEADAVSGTFASRPEGSAIVVNGTTYYLTYRYNAESSQFDNGNDVALFTRAASTVVVSDAGGTYCDAAFAASATVNGVSSLEGVRPTFTYYVGTGTSGTSLGGVAPIDAGTYTVVASFAGSTHFVAAASDPVTFTISPASLAVSVAVDGKIYDGTTTATPHFTLDGRIGTDDVSAACTSATFADKNVGTDKDVTVAGISLSGTDAGNYTLSSATTQTTTASITAASLAVSVTADGKVYDGTTTAAPHFTLDGRIGTDDVSAACTSATFADKNVGTDKEVTIVGISLSGTDAGNYTLSSDTTQTTTASITAASLAVSVTADGKTYDGTTTATPHFTLDGRIGTDDVSAACTSATFADKNVGTDKDVTVAGISLLGTDAGNYTLSSATTQTPMASITAASLAVSVTADGKIYDGTTTATPHFTLDGRIGTDDVSAACTSATFADKNVGTDKEVTVAGISLSGTDAGNYTLSSATTLTPTASISAAALAVTARAYDKVWDGDDSATAYFDYSGRIGTDDVSATCTGANFDSADVGEDKQVTVTGISLTGTDAGNYALSGSTTQTTTASITPAQLRLLAIDQPTLPDDSSASLPASSDGEPRKMAAGPSSFMGDIFGLLNPRLFGTTTRHASAAIPPMASAARYTEAVDHVLDAAFGTAGPNDARQPGRFALSSQLQDSRGGIVFDHLDRRSEGSGGTFADATDEAMSSAAMDNRDTDRDGITQAALGHLTLLRAATRPIKSGLIRTP